MSSSDPAFFAPALSAAALRAPILRTGARPVLVALAAAIALAACTVQPLYGPTPTGQTVVTVVSSIAIDPVDTRVAQQIRNALIFNLDGGNEPSAPLFRMKLTVTSAESALGVTPIEAAPAYSLTVSATYEVTSVATSQIVLRGTSRGTASYDRTNQEYANTRAHLDAEDRAAALAADDIRVRLAVAAAKGTL
jgi:LPS-assembly lipoprotein